MIRWPMTAGMPRLAMNPALLERASPGFAHLAADVRAWGSP
jgi:hypothetical protein